MLKAESQNDCKNWTDSLCSVLEKSTKSFFTGNGSSRISAPINAKRQTSLVGTKINIEEAKNKLNINDGQVPPSKPSLSYSDLQNPSPPAKNQYENTNPKINNNKPEPKYVENIKHISTRFQLSLNSNITDTKPSNLMNEDPYYDNPYDIIVPILDDNLKKSLSFSHHNKVLPTPPYEPPHKLNPLIINNKPLPDSPHSSPSPLTPNRTFNFPVPPPISQLSANLASPVKVDPPTYTKIKPPR